MDPAELDRKARAWKAARKAENLGRQIDRALSRSPRVNARSQLEWLEGRALAGELGPGGCLADYDVRAVIAAAYGK